MVPGHGGEDNHFAFTFYTGFPGSTGPGSAGGFAKVIGTGSKAGDHISGTYSVQGFAPTGAQVFSGTGSFTGTRIEAGS